MSPESYTRPATWDDVLMVAELLSQAGVEFALIGGYAIAAHGYSRFSEDVDILVDPSVENTRRWILALAQLSDGASKELFGQERLFELEGTTPSASTMSSPWMLCQRRAGMAGKNSSDTLSPFM